MTKPCLLLLDGNSLINRAFYGLYGRQNLTAPDGTPTGALFAFLNMYLRYLEDLKPTHVAVAFDRKEPTFRHQVFTDYKATRKPMPEDLARQIPVLKELLSAMGLACLEKAGFEADDLIGSLAQLGKREKLPVIIVTGDKDSFQLIDDEVTVVQPVTRRGLTESETYDPQAIRERYNITPAQFIDFKAIMGDPSDNIPGVRGIGEKGALELLQKYGSLDNIYASLDDIRPSLAGKLQDSRDMAYLSRDLATIKLDMELTETLDDFKLGQENQEKLREILTRLGFRSILTRLDLEPETAQVGQSQTKCQDAQLQDWQSALSADSGDLTVWIDENGLFWSENDFLVKRLPPDMLKESWQDLVKSRIRPAVCDYKQMIKDYQLYPLPPAAHDVLLAGHLLNQLEGRPDLERVYQQVTGRVLPSAAGREPVQTDMFSSLDNEEEKPAADEADIFQDVSHKVQAIREIAAVQKDEIRQRGVERLIYDIEMPLAAILAEMEKRGFLVDEAALELLGTEMEGRLNSLQSEVFALCDCEFNLNSPKQLSEVLYGKLGLTPGKKRSGGAYSTDSDELERLSSDHPAVARIIEHRQVAKLRSTYIEGLKKVIDPDDGRVHTTFNQMLTATGRLSSSEPNLQNIPIRMADGQKIRQAFIAPAGKVLLDADYSQIELRLLAHLSQDQNLLAAFRDNEDIHTNTACHIFNLPPDKITAEMRGIAKTMNFSIVYGISDFGLARDLGITVKLAHKYISEYDQQYPNVRRYLQDLVRQAHEKGYVETLFGRRRYISELKSANRNLRAFGERAAMNTPVQGTAADLIKIAMVSADRKLKEEGLRSALILQVHDELIVEAESGEAEQAAALLREAMENACSLDVPLVAEVKMGTCWAECK